MIQQADICGFTMEELGTLTNMANTFTNMLLEAQIDPAQGTILTATLLYTVMDDNGFLKTISIPVTPDSNLISAALTQYQTAATNEDV